MATNNEHSLYDGRFQRWLDKRVKKMPAHMVQSDHTAPALHKFNLTQVLRAQFDPKALARLDALGIAT